MQNKRGLIRKFCTVIFNNSCYPTNYYLEDVDDVYVIAVFLWYYLPVKGTVNEQLLAFHELLLRRNEKWVSKKTGILFALHTGTAHMKWHGILS